ncbi:MAG: hypothetical protein JWL71_3833 [Acidobacteria bacterium]|nr:hypothetical protein [Acidobacteriota bacterium]
MRRATWLGTTAGVVAAIATGFAQSRAAEKPVEVVVIGCLAPAPQGAFTVEDYRDHIKYRIDASAEVLAPAVSLDRFARGAIEVHGTPAPGNTVRATKVVFLSVKCVQ